MNNETIIEMDAFHNVFRPGSHNQCNPGPRKPIPDLSEGGGRKNYITQAVQPENENVFYILGIIFFVSSVENS
jgi:hypothetical protein